MNVHGKTKWIGEIGDRSQFITGRFVGLSPTCPLKIKNERTARDMPQQFVITDGKRFIYRMHNGKYVPTSSEAMADIFTKKAADRIFENSLSKPLRAQFRVERYDKPSEGIQQVTKQDLEKNTEKVLVAENIQKWIDKLSDLNGLAKDANDRKNILEKELFTVDMEIQDCLHYIEFTKLNAAQGYKAYKILKERRVKRRSIKNELQVLDIILEKKLGETVADEIMKRISGMDNRSYTPRVLTELFDL